MEAETGQERSKRRHQRTLFDSAAELYDATRPGYPSEIVEFMVTTAGLAAGSTVLEVGCGTGQLTQNLARFGFNLTAIDIGPSLIAAARHRLAGVAIAFEASSFEDFEAAEASFDVIVSGTAFHWIDPEVKFDKSVRLLRPGGWLALLSTGERYDDPLGTALLKMWAARSDDGGAWVKRQKLTDTEIMNASGLFERPIHRASESRMVVPSDDVIGVENTRATSLSWPVEIRRGFTEELRQRLRSQAVVSLTQRTELTMARALPGPAPVR